ncbi:FAD-binding protein [Corynebacterium striatum]|nr:FAD-binding protein [Corynebacterium striatum]MDK8843326.1 FAD-binding protein [Corynebacterium striatum]
MRKLIGARGAKNKGFSNWSGSVRTNPREFLQPRSIEEVSQAVQRVGSVRTVGAGHSFTPVAASDGVMMNLDYLSGIVNVDRQLKRVRFLAGTRLRDVPRLLRPFGLALAN